MIILPRQFEIFRHPNIGVAIIDQDDRLASRIVAPLVPLERARPQPRGLSPEVDFGELPQGILRQAMSAVPLARLKEKVGNVPHICGNIIHPVDPLFPGV